MLHKFYDLLYLEDLSQHIQLRSVIPSLTNIGYNVYISPAPA